MTKKESDIIEEITSDIRAEKLHNFIKSHYKLVIFLSFVFFSALFAYESYKDNNLSYNSKITKSLIDNITNEQSKLSNLLTILEDANEPIKDIIEFKVATSYIHNNDIENAVKHLESVIHSQTASPLSKNIAKIAIISIYLDGELEDGINKKIDTFFGTFNNQNDPLYGYGNYLKGLWHIKNGKKNDAKLHYIEVIKSKSTSPIIKEYIDIILKTHLND